MSNIGKIEELLGEHKSLLTHKCETISKARSTVVNIVWSWMFG